MVVWSIAGACFAYAGREQPFASVGSQVKGKCDFIGCAHWLHLHLPGESLRSISSRCRLGLALTSACIEQPPSARCFRPVDRSRPAVSISSCATAWGGALPVSSPGVGALTYNRVLSMSLSARAYSTRASGSVQREASGQAIRAFYTNLWSQRPHPCASLPLCFVVYGVRRTCLTVLELEGPCL